MPDDSVSGLGVPIAGRRDLSLLEVIGVQRDSCEQLGSNLYARILDGVAADIAAGGVCSRILEPWTTNAMADAVPLRFLGAVHRVALDGRAPELAAIYPSCGGTYSRGVEGVDPWPAFVATVDDHADEIASQMARNVQTNEVGRALSLLGGFHTVAARAGLGLRTLEVGASAGLLMNWDRFGYRLGAQTWGGGEGPTFVDGFSTDPPPLDPGCAVVERRGCDVSPIDVTTDAGIAALRGFLWPDQVERRVRLDSAIAVARAHPATVESADAGDWVTEALATPVPGVATVVYHSIVLQYLPRGSFHAMRSAILEAIVAAPANAPVFWLRMEPAGAVADVRLRSRGDDGSVADELLATTSYHGAPIDWLA